MTPLRVTLARHQLDMSIDDLAAMIRDTSADWVEDLPALLAVRFGSDGKPAAMTGVVGCYTGAAFGFDRAVRAASKIRSVLFTAANGWRVFAPLTTELPIPRHGETLRRLEAVFGPIFVRQCRDPAQPYRYGRLPGIKHQVAVTDGVPIERIRLPNELPWNSSKNGDLHLHFGDRHAVARQAEDGWRFAIAGKKGELHWRKPVFSSIEPLKAAVTAELYQAASSIGPD